MKKPKFLASKIFQILKEASLSVRVLELCRKYGMSSASFYNWRSKFGGMDVSNMTRLRELEECALTTSPFAERLMAAVRGVDQSLP